MKIRTKNIKDYLKSIDNANEEINKFLNKTHIATEDFIEESKNKIIEDSETIEPVDANNFFNNYNKTLESLSENIKNIDDIDTYCENDCTILNIIETQIVSDREVEYSSHITKIEFNEYSDMVGYKSLTHDTSNMFNCILTLNTINDEEIIITGDDAYTKITEILNIVKESEKLEK